MVIDWDKIEKFAKKLVLDAGEIIKNSITTELKIEFKSDPNDLVTEMDRKIESFFADKIFSAFPNHNILGEEGIRPSIESLEGIVWIIDPIDGTTNFVHQKKHFAISVAIYENGIGKIGIIYDVIGNELFIAQSGKGAYLNGHRLNEVKESRLHEALIAVNSGWLVKNNNLLHLIKDCRGTRAYGAASLEMTSVAASRLDAYISLRLSPWDFAAGIVILKEVGVRVTTLEGQAVNVLKPSSICVAKESLYAEIKKYL